LTTTCSSIRSQVHYLSGPIRCEDAAGVPALGVVLNPVLEELFVGVVGRGASLNGRPMRTSGEAALPRALLGTEIGVATDPAVLDAMYGRLRAYAAAGRSLRCGGSCALGLCSVAAGRLEDRFLHGRTRARGVSVGKQIDQERPTPTPRVRCGR
jgi:fructose-1,6-bisphosphatase/inositol monophosphatase family enzyme